MEVPPIIIDVDDLICEEQIKDHLVPIRKSVPDFRITCYSVPNHLGDVHALREKYPWILFAIHGFEHTHYECSAWSQSNAEYFIRRSLEMGYAPIFKPPNWVMDAELEAACERTKVLLHHHESYTPQAKGLRCFPGPSALRNEVPKYVPLHSHILRNPVTDFVGDHPAFKVENLKRFSTFLTPLDRSLQL